MLANEDMARVESEAGIIATLIHHPDFSYYSEQLLPNHFTNEENRYIYQAICSLARDGIERIDPYNITGAILTSHLNPNQMKLLAALGCRVVFALDKDVCIRDDHNIKRLKQFVNVQYLWDKDNLLGEKDSPVDRGQETWKKLYEGRLSWR